MAKHADFLVEILTEELPPKSLLRLAESFSKNIQQGLMKAELSFAEVNHFATPRRLAVLVKKLLAEQPSQKIERRGPALAAAFDKEGKPTGACIGFARSCGVTPEALGTIKNAQDEWVGFQQEEPGKPTPALLGEIVKQALAALPIPKPMRWGNNDFAFARPVHSAVILFGGVVVVDEIFGCLTGQETQGHRFHTKRKLKISRPDKYADLLAKQGYVLADFQQRQDKIRELAEQELQRAVGSHAQLVIEEALLQEVTGLVEWPVALCGSFDEHYLQVPSEVLISAMQDHQRYFPVVDKDQKLLPYFITISNIESQDKQRVIAGNERVLRARLADAAFFFATDKKHSLQSRLEKLKEITFQEKLGSVYEKSQRVAQLAATIAKIIKANPEQAERAAWLAKTDLTTEMVGEFPELQGIMGYYYAIHDGLPEEVAMAINEHYMPRFAGDDLPESLLGCAVAIADRLDTLVGIFGIQQAPTGDKDPFGLRRATLGILRIIIDKKLDLDLKELLTLAVQNYGAKFANANVIPQILTFIQERLRAWYQEQDIDAQVFAAVAALQIYQPYDLHRRVEAVQAFKALADAEALIAANKRVSNILAKVAGKISAQTIDKSLFESEEEQTLADMLEKQNKIITPLYQSGDYFAVLLQLAMLRKAVDDFFDKVLVMADEVKRRENRLLLLSQLRALFLQVADIALLQ